MLSHIPLGVKLIVFGLPFSIFNLNTSALLFIGLLTIMVGIISYNWKTICRLSNLVLFNIEFCYLLMAHTKSIWEYVGMINALFAFSIWTERKNRDYYPIEESIYTGNL